MGILFHKLCHRVPDSTAAMVKKQRKLQKKKNPKGRNFGANLKRRRQLDNMALEARIYMYAMSLPTGIVANHDSVIKDELDSLNEEILHRLLGTRIEEEKVRRVCDRIARNILVPAIDNVDVDSDYYPDMPEKDKIRPGIDEQQIKASLLRKIHDECENFTQNHPDVRTWREIRNVADPYRIEGEPLRDVLEQWQWDYAIMCLGLPKLEELTDRQKNIVFAQLDSNAIPAGFRGIRTWRDIDLIIVIPELENTSTTALAAMARPRNVMMLYPRFFHEKHFKSLRNVSVRDGTDFEDIFSCCIRYFIHELTHATGVLETRDHYFLYRDRNGIDKVDTARMIRASDEGLIAKHHKHEVLSAYGLEAFLALERRDRRHNLNKAEDNADSWSFYTMLRMIMLIYPDLDVMDAVRTRSLLVPSPHDV